MIVRSAWWAGLAAAPFAGPTPGELASVLPEIPSADRKNVARAMTAHRFVNAALTRVIARRGSESLKDMVAWRGAEHLVGPAVLVAWHAGAVGAIGAALRKADVAASVFRTQEPEPAKHVQQIIIGRGVAARAAALQQGVDALREGRVVVVVVEALPSTRARHVFLGRHAHLPAGPGALVRLGKARLVPLTSAVVGDRVVFEAHTPLALGVDPTEAYARFFSAYYRARPGELWPEALALAFRGSLFRAGERAAT